MNSLRLFLPGRILHKTAISKCSNKKLNNSGPFLWKSANHFSNSAQIRNQSSYSIEEIQIPNGHQYGYQIACKVWRCGETSSNDLEPPIICTHGWLDNAASFDTLLPLIIRPGRTFYAFDLPGHGLSSHLHTSHYNSHVESHLNIHRLLRHLKLGKVSLLGHSMGAEASVMFAGSFPELVHKLVTLDGVHPNIPQDAESGWVYSTKVFVSSLFEVEDILAKSPQPGPSTYDQLLGRMMKARAGIVGEEGCKLLLGRTIVPVPGTDKFRFAHDLKLRLMPGMGMMTTDQFQEFCSAVAAPTCVIKSSTNDEFSDQASKDFQTAFELAKSGRKDMRIEFHVAEGTHHVHLNNPERVADIISKFLDS